MKNRGGFTLIELSIVLVIIGLIVGGVLVGRSLIEVAAVRAQVSQFEKFEAAVNAFRTKYNGLPGDLRSDQAISMGFATRTGAAGHGDGDGLLEFCDGTEIDTITMVGCETVLFWNDLSTANLIPGNFVLDTDSSGTTSTISFTANNVSQYLPDAKIGNGNSIALYDVTGPSSQQPEVCGRGNFCYFIGANISINPSPHGGAGITPLQAYAMDTKIDDGAPLTGRVNGSALVLHSGFLEFYANTGTPALGVGTCFATPVASVYTYNTGDSTNEDKPVCVLTYAHQ